MYMKYCCTTIDGSFKLPDGRIIGAYVPESIDKGSCNANGGIRGNASTAHYNRLVHTLETERNTLRTKLHARKKVCSVRYILPSNFI
jgi:hypothetical protein